MKTYTASEIKQKIETDQKWLERAVIAIYNKQTENEKNSQETKYHNSVGFSGADAHVMTYCAKWILLGKPLSGKYLELAKKKIVKYVKQLETISKEKITINSLKGAESHIKELAAAKTVQEEKKHVSSFLVEQFYILKTKDKEGNVITTFSQEASSLKGFCSGDPTIQIQGKRFEFDHTDKNSEGEIEGWNYKSSDNFYALIIND